MSTLHQASIIAAFLCMLFSPCVSAWRVMMTWERIDAAYYRFEHSVSLWLEAVPGMVVESNLLIHPVKLRRAPLWAMGPSDPPDMPGAQPVAVEDARVSVVAGRAMAMAA